MGVRFFGMGNFLGGMAEGFSQMAKLQQDKDRLMLESQALDLQGQKMTQDASQFATSVELEKQGMDQRLGIATREADFRDASLAQSGEQFKMSQEQSQKLYLAGLAADEARYQTGRADRAQDTAVNDALSQAYLGDLISKNPNADWAKRLQGLMPSLLGQQGSPGMGNGRASTLGILPTQQGFKGGILGNY